MRHEAWCPPPWVLPVSLCSPGTQRLTLELVLERASGAPCTEPRPDPGGPTFHVCPRQSPAAFPWGSTRLPGSSLEGAVTSCTLSTGTPSVLAWGLPPTAS